MGRGGRNKIYTTLRPNKSRLAAAPAACFLRHHDATPMFLRFGKMVPHLVHTARYLKKVFDPHDPHGLFTRWVTVTYGEYIKDNPNRAPQMGVLEIFGQLAELSYVESGALEGDHVVQPFTIAPCVLSRGTSSCIYQAVDQATALTMQACDTHPPPDARFS